MADPDRNLANAAGVRPDSPVRGGNSTDPPSPEPQGIVPRMSWLVWLALLAAAYGIFASGVWFAGQSTRPPLVGPIAEAANSAPADSASVNSASAARPLPIQVHLAGRVRHPGVYRMPYNARVIDLIHKAGGPLPDADTDTINLASWLEDGTRIEVPSKAKPVPTNRAAAGPEQASDLKPAPPPAAHFAREPARKSAAARSPAKPPHSAGGTGAGKPQKLSPAYLAGHPVNLNSATAEQLQALPGVGPVMADRIIAYRQENGRFQTPDDLENVKGIGDKKMAKLHALVTVR